MENEVEGRNARSWRHLPNSKSVSGAGRGRSCHFCIYRDKADETNQAATPPALVGAEDGSSGGEGEADLWAATAIENVEEEEEPPATTTSEDITVTHAEGETFTMPQTDTAQTSNTPANEFLAAMSNLGSVISTKAREVDQQTGISKKVANVNEKYHVSEKWSNLTTVTKQKTLEIDEKYQVADKWSNLSSSVAARLEQIKEDRRKRME
eukprot:scaffold10919_cov81-Skeletonema_dohrnii-CCMP3373.AAC.1